MKKLKILLTVLLISIMPLCAIDMKFSLGQETSSSLEFNAGEGANNSNPYRFNLNSELDFLINSNHGVLIELNPFMDGSNLKFHLGAGYLLSWPLNENLDLLLGVGPGFVFSSSDIAFNAFLTLDLDIKMSEVMFLRIGTGARVDFGTFGDSFGKRIRIDVPLPALGVGWKF